MTDPIEVLLVDVSDGVATITLNRPESRNALSLELLRALPRAVRDCDARDDVRAIVLTGAEPAFCAGLDLKELGAGKLNAEVAPKDSGERGSDEQGGGAGRWRGPFPATRVPVIGAVNGVAVTGGLELALACDVLIASERARFADTHARVGIMPGWGLSVLLPQAVGLRRAKQMSITGNYVDASTALEWGLVNQVVAHEDLLATAHALAHDVASNDPDAVARLLQTYREGAELTVAEAWRLEGEVARSWRPGGAVDPAEVERRRQAVMQRGRTQVN
jgi:enoyl-CoA hydratase